MQHLLIKDFRLFMFHNVVHTLIPIILIIKHRRGLVFKDDKGIAPDKRIADKTEIVEHDPSDLTKAFTLANAERTYYGLFIIIQTSHAMTIFFKTKSKTRLKEIDQLF